MLERPARLSPITPASAAAPDPVSILNSIGEVVYTWDLASDRIDWGPNAEQVLGLSPSRVATGTAYHDLLSPDSRTSRLETVTSGQTSSQQGGVPFTIQYGLRIDGPGGERAPTTWIDDTGRWFPDAAGRPGRVHGVIRNLSTLARPGDSGSGSANFDPLTGTLSRTRLSDNLARQIEAARRRQSTFAFVLLSLDELAEVNRRYGFDVGDELLAGVGLRLRAQLRVTDTVSRYAGNRFAIVLEACDQTKMLAAARRIERLVSASALNTSAGLISCRVRMGGVVAPTDARNVQAVFQHAEAALAKAKSRASERFVQYEPSFSQSDQKHRSQMMADTIVAALNDGRVTIALQPIVSGSTGQPALFEALMRLRLENGEVLSPAAIFPVAEKSELVQLLDRRVLELALARMQADPTVRISVNMSGKTVHQIGWVDDVAALVRLHPGCADRLIIEITETCAIEDIESTSIAVKGIKALGIKVAMDDFGAGHTSFRNLRRLEVDMLKIDGAFIQNLTRSADDRFFVRTLSELARHLNIPVVAEWIEDRETADVLMGWNIDYLQGDYFGAAMEAGPLDQARSTAA